MQTVDPLERATEKTFYIEDGNARLYTLKDLPATFELVCLKILQQLPKGKDVLFSTDMYVPGSVKSQERMRRGVSERLILEGVKTRRPADFKSFLLNEDNKVQLFELMLHVWSSDVAAPLMQNRHVLLVVNGCVYKLTSADGQVVEKSEVQEFHSTQEETDTRVILYMKYAQDNGYERVIVRSPDSDVFFILLSFAHKFNLRILFDTGSGDKRRLLDISQLANELGDDYCQCLLGIYVFTGEDANCAFKGRGKVTPLKKLEQKPRFQSAFRQLGESWTVDPHLCDELEKFTCLMYGFPRLSSVDAVRAVMLKKMVGEGDKIVRSSKVDLSKLPPCRRSLLPHIKRVNYRVAQWKRSDVRTSQCPDPSAHGWELNTLGVLDPVWSEGPILPTALVDILAVVDDQESDESDEESDLENPDFQCPFSSEDESDFD